MLNSISFAMPCFALPCCALLCLALPCDAVPCTMVENQQRKALLPMPDSISFALPCPALHCSALLCCALCWKTNREKHCYQCLTRLALRCTALRCYAMLCVAVLCNTKNYTKTQITTQSAINASLKNLPRLSHNSRVMHGAGSKSASA